AETGKLAGITNPRDMTYVHSYGGEAIFFESLAKGKLMAARCDNEKCEFKGSIYQPFRIYCPDCLRKMTPIDMKGMTAKVHSFIITARSGAFNTLKLPIKFINVEFEGVSTILMGYLSVGDPKMGMEVVPIFNTKKPTYTIIDLSWVPVGTPESELPENFTF
ncbi:MAG: Zn-ribbon domain-containing OB-fold protein, partial [Promethearchaeota archaeon]